MARHGSFGRRPTGSGGNLAALIASLNREHQAAQDRAIFDAYNNGGLFEGKPVTDQRILDYIQVRRDGFDKSDPLYDQWNNSFIQQKFSIGEQKIGLAYKQGKASASDVAHFYQGQLASIPKDSAFYRDVAGRAAQWAKAARAASGGSRSGGGGSGSASKSLTALYKQSGDNLQNQLAANEYVDFAIRAALAREGYTIPDNVPVLNVGAQTIIDLFNQGKVIGTNGVVSLDAYHQLTTNVNNAYSTAIKYYQATGHNYLTLIDAQHSFQQDTYSKIPTLPFQQRAEAAYSLLNDALGAAQGDPGLIAKAYAQALGLLTTLSNDAQKAGIDPTIVSALKNDVTTLSGGSAKGASFLDTLMEQRALTGQDTWRFLTPDPNVPSPSAQVTQDVTATTAGQQLVASGNGYLVQDAKTGALSVVDSAIQPKGTLPQEYQSTIVNIGGVPTQVFLHGTVIVANTATDANGNPIDPRNLTTGEVKNSAVVLGYEFTFNQGGQTITSWAVRQTDANGNPTLVFTQTDPFLGKTTTNANGTITVETPTLNGQPITIDSYLDPNAMAHATSSLVIDSTAQQTITSNPERAYELYKTGKIDGATLVSALNAPAGTTPEMAVALTQSAKAIAGPNADTRSEGYGITHSAPSVAQQGASVAQNIILNLSGANVGRGQQAAVNPVGTPPPVNVPKVTFTPQQTQTALINQRAGEKSLVDPIPVAPIAPKPPSIGLKPPSVSAGSLAAGISDTTTKTPTAPTTTKITSGQYSGKTVPL